MTDPTDPSAAEYQAGWPATGHRFRVARIALGITEAEAAAAASVSVRTWKRWEAGGRQRGMSGAVGFSSKFDVSLDWLFQGEGCGLRQHLRVNRWGNVAILPVVGPFCRLMLARRAS